jgi:hypothetical protein
VTAQCEFSDVCPVYKVYSRVSSKKAGQHLVNAKKEMLLAVKSFVEAALEKAEKEEKGRAKAKKVKIT